MRADLRAKHLSLADVAVETSDSEQVRKSRFQRFLDVVVSFVRSIHNRADRTLEVSEPRTPRWCFFSCILSPIQQFLLARARTVIRCASLRPLDPSDPHGQTKGLSSADIAQFEGVHLISAKLVTRDCSVCESELPRPVPPSTSPIKRLHPSDIFGTILP